ncbi:putative signal transducing protein [Pseudomonas matsuisoli]|uniref:DUF2007 domain-containing protein n=1 Tax=Pseudomonas matsuisoli TaxID=1515666 RepID=A0A917Q291_9PSED|nr:DUF2007 domain-containing protein [Pseudomonas matsuisoli]GGK07361.1 hypothetical protein GCM10009304_36990 [Pseudomonas matsuisoli]
MRRVYEPRDLLEAEMLVGMLEAEGIDAHLSGRHLIGAVGELPVAGLLGIHVDDERADRARILIDTYNAAEPQQYEEPDSFPGELLC